MSRPVRPTSTPTTRRRRRSRSSQAAATPPGRLRIAVSTKFPPGVLARLDADAERALRETAELLRSLGHEVSERDPDWLGPALALVPRYLGGAHQDVQTLAHPERLERRTRTVARLGGLLLAALLERSLAAEAEFARRLNGVFAEHDVLLTPATAAPPPQIGQLQGRGALVDAQRRLRLGALQRRLERHGPAGGVGAGWTRRRRPAARGAARRTAERRGDTAVARGADRGRARMAADAPAGARMRREASGTSWAGETGERGAAGSAADELLALAVEAARLAGGLLLARAQGGSSTTSAARARRPISSARPTSARSGRSASCCASVARTTASWGRRRATPSRAPAACAGSSIRSTAPSTSCSAFRSGRSASPCATTRDDCRCRARRQPR